MSEEKWKPITIPSEIQVFLCEVFIVYTLAWYSYWNECSVSQQQCISITGPVVEYVSNKESNVCTANTTTDPNQRVCKYRTIECCTDVKSDPCFFSNEVVHSFCCLEARANSAAKSQIDDLSQEKQPPYGSIGLALPLSKWGYYIMIWCLWCLGVSGYGAGFPWSRGPGAPIDYTS